MIISTHYIDHHIIPGFFRKPWKKQDIQWAVFHGTSNPTTLFAGAKPVKFHSFGTAENSSHGLFTGPHGWCEKLQGVRTPLELWKSLSGVTESLAEYVEVPFLLHFISYRGSDHVTVGWLVGWVRGIFHDEFFMATPWNNHPNEPTRMQGRMAWTKFLVHFDWPVLGCMEIQPFVYL